MHINKPIIISVGVITILGVMNAITHQRVVSRVILGGYVLLFVLAILDLFGPAVGQIAGAIAMMAALFMALTFIPWTGLLTIVRGKTPVVK